MVQHRKTEQCGTQYQTPPSYQFLELIKDRTSLFYDAVSKEFQSAYLFQLVHPFLYTANRCQCSQRLGIKAPETILATNLKKSNYTSFLQRKKKNLKSSTEYFSGIKTRWGRGADSFSNLSKLAIITAPTKRMLSSHRELKLINAYTLSNEKVI